MSKCKDLSGMKFGRLVAIKLDHIRGRGRAYWLCRCECGAFNICRSDVLTGGKSKSCGCLQKDVMAFAVRKHGETVNDKKSPEYRAWGNMRSRCANPNHPHFHHYGGRGISVCDEWSSFDAFLRDMGRRPTDGHSIDRIDNNGNYEPSNCRWATKYQQSRNTRANRRIPTPLGEMLVCDAVETLGVNGPRIRNRLSAGWPESDVLLDKRPASR